MAISAAVSVVAAMYIIVACSTFDGSPADPLETSSPDPRVEDGSKADAPYDGAITDAAVVPYCLTLDSALLCNEFPTPPITLGWSSVGNMDAGGTAEWTGEAGATQPGAGVFSTGMIPGSAQTARIYLSRGVPIPTKAPDTLRLELAIRLDEIPDLGDMAVLRLFTGQAIFYIYHSQLGYAFVHSYYAPICPTGPGPCLGGRIDGTKPPIPLRTWDRLSITVVKKAEAGTGSHITFEAASGEKLAVDSPAGFTPDISPDAYLEVGFTVLSPATKARVFVVDDLSLTAR